MIQQVLANGVRYPLSRPDVENIYKLDTCAVPMVVAMHQNGIYLDLDVLGILETELRDTMSDLMRAIREEAGEDLNPASGDQVAALFYDKWKLNEKAKRKIKLTDSGDRLSADDVALDSIRHLHPCVDLVSDWRAANKILTTYVVALPHHRNPDTGLVHTTFSVTTTDTGRLASYDPNLMNIPTRERSSKWALIVNMGKRVRQSFRPRRHRRVYISLDLSQIEMVTAAELSGDQTMLEIFAKGEDLHTKTALLIFEFEPEFRKSIETLGEKSPYWKEFKSKHRAPAKTVGFGILYGVSDEGLQTQIVLAGGPLKTITECGELKTGWFRVFNGVARWVERQQSNVARYGCNWDPFGRLRAVPSTWSTVRGIREAGIRESVNFPIQSGAQGVIKLAMWDIARLCSIYRSLGEDVREVLQIHDELVFDVPEGIAEEFAAAGRAIMENSVRFQVPIRSSSDIAPTWGDLK